MENEGIAYGFFNCRGTIDKIIREFRSIIYETNHMSRLEIYDTENYDTFISNPRLVKIAREAIAFGANYTVINGYPEKTSKEAADSLKKFMSRAYNPNLYSEEEGFVCAIFYEEHDKFIPLK